MTAPHRTRTAVGHARRPRPVRRASAGLSPVRAGALLAMLVSAGAIYGATASSAFEVGETELHGVRYSDPAAVRARLVVPDGANAFTLATEPLEQALLELPTVARANVTVRLPGALAVDVVERQPILVWEVDSRRFLADVGGTLFAELAPGASDEAAALPIVEDRREASAALAVGRRLDPVDLDAARRLGSLSPADVGSSGSAVRLSVSDASGFVIRGQPGWTAIFGFYTPSLRTPEIIPGQVRLLRSLLVEQGERNVARIVLASETDGTFTTPAPAASVAP